MTDFSPRAVYTSGKASSAAGLTAAVVKDDESGKNIRIWDVHIRGHTIALRTVKVEVRRNAGLTFSSFLVWFCLLLAGQKQVQQKNEAL